MSQAGGIPFKQATTLSKYRLIELPMGLDTLLTSSAAPRLKLSPSPDDPSNSILSTPDKIYALRQKNTSNSLMILRPSGDGVEVASTIYETVELDAVTSKTVGKDSGVVDGKTRHTGSRGKWHERFGTGR